MALHNYVYLKHREHDSHCHQLLVREKDIVLPSGAVRPGLAQANGVKAGVAAGTGPGAGAGAEAAAPEPVSTSQP